MLSINLVCLKSVSDMAAILRITYFFHTLSLELSRQVVVKSNYYDRYSKGEFTFSFSTRECNKKISARELFQVRTPKKSFCSVVMAKFTWLFAVISQYVIVISKFPVSVRCRDPKKGSIFCEDCLNQRFLKFIRTMWCSTENNFEKLMVLLL